MDHMLVRRSDVYGKQPQHYKPSRLDEITWVSMAFQSPRPTETTWAAPTASCSNRRSGQTSPLGERIATGCDNTNTAPVSYPTSSSCDGSWTSGATDHEEVEGDGNWDEEWEQGSDSKSVIPKIEPMEEEDVAMAKLNHTPLAPKEIANASSKQKRPRGRPKKNTAPTSANSTKVVKGRSKTGCITCRKRKKKCDEAKPGCLNCEKNSVVCEGYNEKQLWRSATERRADEGRLKREYFPVVTLPTIVLGFETPEDKMFYDHYVNRLSNVLTVETEQRNAFRDILLNLATKHQGLLHSIMAISSMHIDTTTPYGSALLQRHPTVTKDSLQQRSSYHVSAAWTCLRSDIDKSESLDPDDPDSHLILAARYGQMICLVLQNLIEGNPRGEHRVHLKAYQKLIRQSPPHDMVLHTFITEFFQYHIYADDILWHPENHIPRLSVEEADEPPTDGDMACLLGVKDGLFRHLREITSLRNTIRNNMIVSNNNPAASYVEIVQANDIGHALQSWKPNWQAGDSRAKAGELYRLALWIYLFRTAFPPATGTTDHVLGGSAMMGFMTARRSSIASSSGQLSNGFCEETTFPRDQNRRYSRHASRTSSMHEEDGLPTPATTHGNGSSCPPSPPPSRRPSQDDKRVAPSIMEALDILESFDPSEPCQSLLLIPCLLLGTACFDAAQHPRIRAAIQAVRTYTGLRNADRVQEVLDETWALMDKGDWVAVWDWQIIASRRGLDFLCT